MKTKFLILLLSFLIHSVSFAKTEKATFAGGCFWCIESAFDGKPGVMKALSGYSGGKKKTANYKLVSSGKTKHLEAVQITFDSTKISYKSLLEIFWRSINPTDGGGQFADRGEHYKTAIFYHNQEQKELAQKSKQLLEKSKIFKKKIVVPLLNYKNFFPAEDYHQDYHLKKSKAYKRYYYGSGRGNYLEHIWSNRKNFKIFKESK